MKTWIKIALVVVLLIIGAGVLLIDVVLEGIVKTKLESAIKMDANRIYDYRFDKVTTKLLSGKLILKGLRISPRNDVLDSLAKKGNIKKSIYEIELEQFRLEGLDSWRLLMDNEISIRSIYFDQPRIKVYTNKKASIGSSKNLAKDILAPNIPWSMIDSFKLENARFEIYHIKEDTSLAISFDSLNLSLYSFHVDSTLVANGMFFNYDDLALKVKNFNIHSLPNFDVDFHSFYFKRAENEIRLSKISVRPKTDKYEYMKTQKYETDWISFNIDKLYLRNINFDKLHEFGKLELAEVEIENPVFEVYRDKRLPDRPYKFVPLYTRLLRNLKFPFHVANVKMSNAKVTYIEWVDNAKQPGVLRMDKMHAEIANLGSDHDFLNVNDTLKITGKARLFGSGNMTFKFKSSVLDTNDLFETSGDITDLEFKELNPLLENLAFVKFETGKINFIKFNMTADNVRSKGVLDIDYSGFKKVTFLRNKEELEVKAQKGKAGKKEKQNKKLMSFLANTYLLNDYNPTLKNYYQGKIHFDRIQNKAIFNYMLKSIMTGVQSSVLPNFEDDWKEVKSEHKKKEKEVKMAKKKKRKKSK